MNNEYTPEKWQIVKIFGKNIPTTYKVFACWYGGYLGSNSWKMNSGITKVTKEEDFYLFEGYSGSVYKCHEKTYGMHMYGHGVLDGIIERSKEAGMTVEIMPEDTNWLDLSYE